MNKQYGVSAAHPLAVEVGMNVMEQGGNAVDAAVAISIALGVVEPYASGIGGGGNMLIFPVEGTDPVVYDYREMAPSQLNKKYQIGVPGLIKGMETIAEDFGRFSFAKLLEPAIELAENGFPIGKVLATQLIMTKHKHLKSYEHFYPGQMPLQENETLIQKALAESLKKIAKYGSDYFYQGELARKFAAANVGITLEDMEGYEIKIRKPLKSEYGSLDLWSAPAPVGGAYIIQTLRLAELLDIDQLHVLSPDFIAIFGKMMQELTKRRMTYNGDPEFNVINESDIISDRYIEEIAQEIKQSTYDPTIMLKDSNHTTHFSVVDADGMAVSTTNTLSHFFGSGVYVEGIFLNNQMQNFSDNPDSPNKYEVGKRCQSIIAPTILSKDHKPVLVVGASGAARIPTIIATTIFKYIKQGYSLEEAISESRFFVSQNKVMLEEEMNEKDVHLLQQHGYTPVHFPEPMFYGGVQALAIKNGELEGAADPRRGGIFKKKMIDESR